jgi:fibrobacter succinogenes major domain (fib_succ_major)|nr:MAG TPA: Fibrobacter succinogenes major paralogous domain [Bacteriophage sp.]
MTKGLYFYKLVSPYTEDVTKNCKLTVNEIDSNFLHLKDADIAKGEFDKKTNTLKLTKNDGDLINVDLSPLMNNGITVDKVHFAGTEACSGDCTDKNSFSFKYSTGQTDENGNPIEKGFKIEFSDIDGKLWITDSNNDKHLIGTFLTDKMKADKNSDGNAYMGFLKEVITDGSILGNGKSGDPLRLNPTEKTGYYSPAKSLIDTRNDKGTGLPVNPCKGDRYVTLSCNSKGGRLYTMNGVKEIEAKLKAGWRIPTKQDWDNMLNAIEPCQYQNHNDIHCHLELGKLAGKQLKATDCWQCDVPNAPQSDDTYLYDDKVAEEKPISADGVDKYGMGIFPGGYGIDKNEDIIKYKKIGKYWTSSQTIKGEGYDYYVKVFQHNKHGVIQATECPEHFLSLRLVKDYTGSNNYGAEVIGGNTYQTVLLPTLNVENGFTVWTAKNINEDVTDENELEYNEFYEECAGCNPTYILHEWNGSMWTHKIMVEGDTIVIHDPITAEDFLDSEYRIVNGKLINTNKQMYNDILSKVTPLINLLTNGLNKEIEDRTNANTEINGKIDTINETLVSLDNADKAEKTAREKAIEGVYETLNAVTEHLIDEDTKLKEALSKEVEDRKAGDNTLQEGITAERERAESVEAELREGLAVKWENRKEIENALLKGGAYTIYSNGTTEIPSKDQTDENKGTNNITLIFNANYGRF